MLLNQTRKELRRLALYPRKGLGQHFLVDERVLTGLVSAAELSADDTVVEVGPGLGTLTAELARAAGRVIAVELDGRMAAALSQRFASVDRVSIVNRDILECAPQSLVGSGSGYKVVGTLPYNIASAVLRHFLQSQARPSLLAVVLQKEVARTIAAAPGRMGLLSVSVQFYGRPRIVSYIPPRSFYPRPRVESAILRIDVYGRPPLAVASEEGFFKVVRGGFAAPRKQLRNSLAQGLGMSTQQVEAWLEAAGIERQRRAGTLSLEEWAALYRAFAEEL